VAFRFFPNGGGAAPWAKFDGTWTSSPAATVDAAGRVYVAARDGQGHVSLRWRNTNGAWTPWFAVGGTTTSAPAVASVPAQGMIPAAIYVTARDNVGRVAYRTVQPGVAPAVVPWKQVGSLVTSTGPQVSAEAHAPCAPPDGPPAPLVAVFTTRGPDLRTQQARVCPGFAFAGWSQRATAQTASSADLGDGRAWYRTPGGALAAANGPSTWVIGTPPNVATVASAPTVADEHTAVPGLTVLVRGTNGSTWSYRTLGPNPVGGSWTNLSFTAT
jgi:hypothetical protein